MSVKSGATEGNTLPNPLSATRTVRWLSEFVTGDDGVNVEAIVPLAL